MGPPGTGAAGLILMVAAAAIVGVALYSVVSTGADTPAALLRLVVAVAVPLAIVVSYWLTARRRVRAAMEELVARADRDRALVDRVSHRLRDQLTVLYGFSETLLDSQLDDRVEVRDVVSVINAEAVDLSRVVDDLVSAAELESHAFDTASVKFDPSVEIERVVVPFRRQGHTVSVDCWTATALSDAIRFRQIVRALVSNAVRHGGKEIAVVGEADGDAFRVTVADDGRGIGPELERGLFGGAAADSDVRATGGSGLGLAVASAIASRLGGRLEYARSHGLTMFTLVLPTAGWPHPPKPPSTPIGDGEDVYSRDEAVVADAGVATPAVDPPRPSPVSPSPVSPSPVPERRIRFSDDTTDGAHPGRGGDGADPADGTGADVEADGAAIGAAAPT